MRLRFSVLLLLGVVLSVTPASAQMAQPAGRFIFDAPVPELPPPTLFVTFGSDGVMRQGGPAGDPRCVVFEGTRSIVGMLESPFALAGAVVTITDESEDAAIDAARRLVLLHAANGSRRVTIEFRFLPQTGLEPIEVVSEPLL